MKKLVILAVAGLTLASAVAFAQMQHGPGAPPHGGMGPGHGMQGGMHGNMGRHGSSQPAGGHGTGTAPKGDTSPASLAFHAINAKMHTAMDITFTGNADVDFVKGMIPHHEGAVDMAKTVLAFGKDPAIRKLAEDIVKAQDSEIAMMKAWLEKNAR
jgi:hypothetical protein